MAKKAKTVLLWVFLVALTCGGVSENVNGFSQRDGGLYLDDAVIINAAVTRIRRDTISNSTREARQLYLIRPRQQNEAFGLDCETSTGTKGTCKSYKDCYPLFKVADFSGADGWLMGNYDTCSYITEYNREVYGVCCTKPVGTPPQQEPDVQRWGVLPPAMPYQLPALRLSDYHNRLLSQLKQHTQWLTNANAADVRQIPANWPPPIPPLPTHPPDHTAPTHPPSLVAGSPTSPRPPSDEPQPAPPPAWPTVPPQQTTAQTTKQTWPPLQPTQPTVDGSCGIKNGPQTYESSYDIQDEERIVGGHNAELNEWPWIVALFNGGRQFCGGSLIDDRHVLSAAHCVAHMTSWDVVRLTARLGDYNIRTNAETTHIERKIKRVVRHRGFDMRTLYNDVSVLTLDQPVTFTKKIRPICLPSGGARAYSGVVATVIGWGSLRENGPQPSVLQEVSIPVWTNSDCRLKYGAAAPGGIVDHMLCAGKASMDSCSGDSGGPLMVNDGGRWTQVGIVSWGIGCGKGQYPGVYSRVTSFLPWIQKNSQ